MSPLADWSNYYVIVGSSAGALTGLMFVVITLIAGERRRGSNGGGDVAAYGTPNVFHFCVVLFVCAMLAAPWQSLPVVGALLVLTGFGGVIYALIIFRRIVSRARLEGTYNPVLEDWLWFGVFPLLAYVAFDVAAVLFAFDPKPALFIVAGAMILLLIIGIHNAWDTVTYLTFDDQRPSDDAKKASGPRDEKKQ